MRRIAVVTGAAALLFAAGAGVWAAAHPDSSPVAGNPHDVSVSTARVTRRDLVTTDRVDGTLGFGTTAPVVNRLAGTYTQLPNPGDVIQPGTELYAVDGQPVVLLGGALPAWRPFTANMADGPDVAELEGALRTTAAGSASLGAPNPHFDAATANAITRWQHSLHMTESGSLELGRVVFLPGAVRVGAHRAELGSAAEPGQPPYDVTSTARVVTVALDAAKQGEVAVGAPVTIDMFTRTVPGHITSVSHVAVAAPNGGQGSNGGSPTPEIAVVVTPDDPAATGDVDQAPVQVELTVDAHRHVLAVPVTALVAVGERGEAVEVVDRAGGRRLVNVTTGVASGGLVEIAEPGIAEGTTVVVGQ